MTADDGINSVDDGGGGDCAVVGGVSTGCGGGGSASSRLSTSSTRLDIPHMSDVRDFTIPMYCSDSFSKVSQPGCADVLG